MGESKLVAFSKQGSLPIPAKPPKDQGQIPEEGVSCGELAAVAPRSWRRGAPACRVIESVLTPGLRVTLQ